jgi:hypothetical protein
MCSKYLKLPQAELREKFHCYGHFYTLQLTDGSLIPCRSLLEIVLAGNSLDNETYPKTHLPDAITIMMNPGGSEPDLSQTPGFLEEQINLNAFKSDYQAKRLIRAIPDTTQDRIMNIMNVLGWNHVRILNLSDIREVDSAFLSKHLHKFNNTDFSNNHSIFSSHRKAEIESALNIGELPLLIYGWGTEDSLEKIAEYAVAFFATKPNLYVGIRQNDYYFYHPGRRKNWHDDILDQIYDVI